ncbi:hypothetical protein EK21DRAFT_117136 [Setomelanomma holmii]|uniref:Uncharacterized protein n=1 Tax=Setomelanomma holmii TaxID=210430 RepID=A0A9P4H0M2_9PLEO|nr:hypothetical protein EK21DRAFT_117136 [Setomelanomma holmii]
MAKPQVFTTSTTQPTWTNPFRNLSSKPLFPITAPTQSSPQPNNTKFVPWRPLPSPFGPVKRNDPGLLAEQPASKKPKVTTQEQKINDELFRTAQTPNFGGIQPVGTKTGQIPLSNVERWRLRGWRWEEAVFGMHDVDSGDTVSPKGTRFVSKL